MVLRKGFALTLPSVAVLACSQLSPFAPSDRTVPVLACEFEARYANAWKTIDPAPVETDGPHRELLQQGVPTPDTLVFWHKYPTTKSACGHGFDTSSKVPLSLPQLAPPAEVNLVRFDCRAAAGRVSRAGCDGANDVGRGGGLDRCYDS